MPGSFSIVIPAHNEEAYIGPCLEAARTAASRIDPPVEIVVVLNRCTDRTEEIARAAGAVVIPDESRCLAKIRN